MILDAFRASLTHKGVDAYYIPKHDLYFGEYVQPHDDVLAFISGFTGSFGYAIVTQDKAYLFVDRRYTLQASMETNTDVWTICSLLDNPLSAFLESLNVGTLGFDPWRITTEQTDKIVSAGVTLVPMMEDFFDSLWLDRPERLYHPIYPYPIEYAGCSMVDKIQKVQSQIETPLLVLSPDQICWLLNIRGNDVMYTPLIHAYAIVPISGPVKLFLEGPHGALPDHFGHYVTIFPKTDFLEHVGRYSKMIGKNVPYAISDKTKIMRGPDIITSLKAIKNEAEQDGMRKAHKMDGIAVINAIQTIKQNVDTLTEMDVDTILLAERQKFKSFQGPSFPTIAGSGPHGAIIHYRATEKTNKRLTDNILLIDSGGQYLEGTTDITRTIALFPPTQEEKEAYTRVLKGNIALSRIQFPVGTTGGMLDVLARQYLWNVGLDYQHGTGHGVGCFLNVHEGPQSISKNSTVPLQVGMILSIEPGFYKEGHFGIRLENLALVVPSIYPNFLAFETLTTVPFDDTLILESMLTKEEIDWIKKIMTNAQTFGDSINF